MTQNWLSFRGALFLIIAIEISAVSVAGLFGKSGTDGWLAILLAALPAIPLMLIFSRLCCLLPGKSLPEMIETLFGRAGGIIAGIIYGCGFILLAAVILSEYTGFIRLSSLPRTGPVVICLVLFALCAYLCRSGIETVGKWGAVTGVLFLIILAALIAFSIEDIKPGNLLPVFISSKETLLEDALRIFALTHGGLVTLLFFAGDFAGDIKPPRLFFAALGAGILISVIIFLHNCAVLGSNTAAGSEFPLYKAAGVVDAGGVGLRLETLVAFGFILIGMTKISAMLLAGARAMSSAFKKPDPLKLAVPAGIIAFALSVSLFGDAAERAALVREFMPRAIPALGGFLPVIIWLFAELRKKK